MDDRDIVVAEPLHPRRGQPGQLARAARSRSPRFGDPARSPRPHSPSRRRSRAPCRPARPRPPRSSARRYRAGRWSGRPRSAAANPHRHGRRADRARTPRAAPRASPRAGARSPIPRPAICRSTISSREPAKSAMIHRMNEKSARSSLRPRRRSGAADRARAQRLSALRVSLSDTISQRGDQHQAGGRGERQSERREPPGEGQDRGQQAEPDHMRQREIARAGPLEDQVAEQIERRPAEQGRDRGGGRRPAGMGDRHLVRGGGDDDAGDDRNVEIGVGEPRHPARILVLGELPRRPLGADVEIEPPHRDRADEGAGEGGDRPPTPCGLRRRRRR